MIDIHTHIITAWDAEPLTEEKLLKKMDELEMEKFAVLPVGPSPETPYFYFGPEDVLEAYHRHPDRIIPFCNLDPRQGYNSPKTDFTWILNKYKSEGFKGLGELTSNLYFDDPLCMNLYHYCGKFKLPITFHLYNEFGGTYGLVDDINLPRLEKALKEFPETIFLGHAMAFWSEISADIDEKTRGDYPKNAIKSPGRLQYLLKKYPNLYGDLSAGSGYNAISRDKEYGYKFLEEFQNKLLFGTDIANVGQKIPILDYFKNIKKESKISKIAFDKITKNNAIKLFDL
ncbi:MAG: amidohydrolase family protein [Elusimicrobia bacterium]|nr:amidohydrolase family protein [Elusimicrobiota bacterium]